MEKRSGEELTASLPCACLSCLSAYYGYGMVWYGRYACLPPAYTIRTPHRTGTLYTRAQVGGEEGTEQGRAGQGMNERATHQLRLPPCHRDRGRQAQMGIQSTLYPYLLRIRAPCFVLTRQAGTTGTGTNPTVARKEVGGCVVTAIIG